ncbi:AraC family transcriptional regulator, partial [Halodesulfovibrio sp. MK-HDV]|uniref:AraC family transcriptional regulator n=1 Tax=Halodesulfovibrio sp. MK-HDV TaxID=2599925 RepID=UPI001C20354F
IRYIEQNAMKQPSLDTIAAHVHLSKHHFSRLFKQWVGVTPIQFLHFLTVEYTKKMPRRKNFYSRHCTLCRTVWIKQASRFIYQL